eukprot:910069-Lingulodinium_polyedra.AAC.1
MAFLSGESVVDLCSPAGETLYCAQGDVESCYYQYLLLEPFRDRFGAPRLDSLFPPRQLRQQLGARVGTLRPRLQ